MVVDNEGETYIEEGPAFIIQVDQSDTSLPYRIQQGRNECWMKAESLRKAEVK
jgi:hypothetical protein